MPRRLIALLVLAAACTTPVASSRPARTSTPSPAASTSAPAPSPTLTPTVTPSPTPSYRPTITIALTGDVHAVEHLGRAIDAGADPLAAIAPVLSTADLTIVNLETAVGVRGRPAPKEYTFQSPTSLWGVLTRAGVDVVSLANNHSLDFGVGALRETWHGARTAGLTTVGGGVDATEAYAPALFELQGQRVAVVGLTRVIPVPEWAAGDDHVGLASAYDVDAAVAAVQAAAAVAQHVIVTIHWGAEHTDCQVEHQLDLASRLRAAGADVIAGHHPHVLQSTGEIDGSVVAYSLGNFLWYSAGATSRLSGVLTVTLDAHGVVAWEVVPVVVDPSDGPQPATGADAEAVASRLRRVERTCAA